MLKNKNFHFALLFFVPMFSIHIFSKSIGYHYSITIIAPLLYFIMKNFNLNTAAMDKKKLIFCIILLISTSIGRYTRATTRPFKQKESACTHENSKNKEIFKIKNIIQEYDKHGINILATGGILPQIITAKSNFYQTDSYSKKQNFYDLLILEKFGDGKLWKVSSKKLNQAWNRCQKENLLFKGEHFLIIKDPSKDCFSTVY